MIIEVYDLMRPEGDRILEIISRKPFERKRSQFVMYKGAQYKVYQGVTKVGRIYLHKPTEEIIKQEARNT